MADGGAIWGHIVDVEILRPRQVGPVAPRLIPALHGGGDGVENDGDIQRPGVFPSTGDFLAEALAVGIVELGDILKVGRILGDQGSFAQQRERVNHIVPLREFLDVLHKLLFGQAHQRVLDFARRVLHHGHHALLSDGGGIPVVPIGGRGVVRVVAIVGALGDGAFTGTLMLGMICDGKIMKPTVKHRDTWAKKVVNGG